MQPYHYMFSRFPWQFYILDESLGKTTVVYVHRSSLTCPAAYLLRVILVNSTATWKESSMPILYVYLSLNSTTIQIWKPRFTFFTILWAQLLTWTIYFSWKAFSLIYIILMSYKSDIFYRNQFQDTTQLLCKYSNNVFDAGLDGKSDSSDYKKINPHLLILSDFGSIQTDKPLSVQYDILQSSKYIWKNGFLFVKRKMECSYKLLYNKPSYSWV